MTPAIDLRQNNLILTNYWGSFLGSKLKEIVFSIPNRPLTPDMTPRDSLKLSYVDLGLILEDLFLS
jgi:hypothetical protein